MATLIDTSVLVAYFNTDDSLHEAALRLVSSTDDFLITDYVFDEFLNVLSRRKNKHNAIKAGKLLLSTSHSFTTVSSAEFVKAWERFQESTNFSFTDCTNLAVMETFGTTQIATFDKEFEKVKGIRVMK